MEGPIARPAASLTHTNFISPKLHVLGYDSSTMMQSVGRSRRRRFPAHQPCASAPLPALVVLLIEEIELLHQQQQVSRLELYKPRYLQE